MLSRKTRIHHHGLSNRSLPHCSQTYSNFYSPHQQSLSQSTSFLKNPFTYFLKKQPERRKQLKKGYLKSQVREEKEYALEKDLKKQYKNSKDMIKLLKHWGMGAEGFISREQFKHHVKKNRKEELSDQQIDQILVKYSGSREQIGAEGLISLLHSKVEGIPIDSGELPLEKSNANRQQLIDNLKEDLKHYTSPTQAELTSDTLNQLLAKVNTGVSRMKQKQVKISGKKDNFFHKLKCHQQFNPFEETLLHKIQNKIDFDVLKDHLRMNKNADNLIVDPLLRCSRNPNQTRTTSDQEHEQFSQTFAENLRSLPKQFSKTLNSENKRKPFDPLSLLNVDQRKTRFKGSQFTNEGSGWNPSCQHQTVQIGQKTKILKTLQNQVQVKQIRYQNKLNKMRAFRSAEQEGILLKDQVAEEREGHRLGRIRDQQQAYNYVNFIKKKWE